MIWTVLDHQCLLKEVMELLRFHVWSLAIRIWVAQDFEPRLKPDLKYDLQGWPWIRTASSEAKASGHRRRGLTWPISEIGASPDSSSAGKKNRFCRPRSKNRNRKRRRSKRFRKCRLISRRMNNNTGKDCFGPSMSEFSNGPKKRVTNGKKANQ